MKRTDKYDLAYFEEGDLTNSIYEMQRWETLDAQLYSAFSVLGNGVLSGWNILPSSGLSVVITEGSGHVAFVAVKTTENVTVSSLTPNTRNYIYASLTDSSYWDQSVSFVNFVSEDNIENDLLIGYVDTDDDSVVSVNVDVRSQLGFVSLIQQLIAEHRHIGGTNNPSPVNLGTDVQGILNQNNLPDLDASIIKSGIIDDDRLPKIDHITKLINQGTLTHAQLDSFVEALNISGVSLMGEVSTVDLLQLILALKHAYPDIDEFLVNEIAYIPGISPDSYVDWENTTATVDTRTYAQGGEHVITGESSTGKEAFTKTWNTESEFKSGTYHDVTIDGDNVCLATTEKTLMVEAFETITSVDNWEVITSDTSSVQATLEADPNDPVIPSYSGKLDVHDTAVELSLSFKKEFDAQDWSAYSYIIFYLKTESVQHGDVYFYLTDANAGTQNSYTKVLYRNTPTINIDTLQNGWQQITVDITPFTRSAINTLGFYVSSQDGWDTSKGFTLNIDSVYLTTGNEYKEDGYMRVIFGGDFLYEFWRVRWEASIPTDSHSEGLVLKSRTRVGNTLPDLEQSAWSSYSSTSGYEIQLPSEALYKYIEIEMYFGASNDKTRSACLKKLFLDFYALSSENSFTYNTKDEWDSGNKFNIDTSAFPGTMIISKTDEIGDIFYGTTGSAKQLDHDLTELYKITGSVIPRNTYQILNNLQPSLGLVSGVSRGNNGNVWLSDLTNDRVVELDKAGALINGFYGSFINPPFDYYGKEEMGPGSNEDIATTTTTTTPSSSTSSTTTVALGSTLDVLHSIYNSEDGVLYIVFNRDLENIYDPATTLNLTKMYLKIGTQRFYLNDSSVELLGVDKDGYDNWYALSSNTNDNAEFINQFKFTSHVLKITLNGGDKTILNYMVNQTAPSIVIASPNEQQKTNFSVDVNFVLYNFELGTQAGENSIKITLDGGAPQTIYSTKISYTGLLNGLHTVTAQLVNADGSLNTNIEANATGTFFVHPGQYNQPYIYLTTPKPNQIYASSPVVVEFVIKNFPILSTGQHLRYFVDAEAPVDVFSTSPITLEDLDAGEHTITLYLVDSNGNDLGYTYGTVVGDFIVGLNSKARTKLIVESNAVYNINKNITTDNSVTDVDVGNIYFQNIYSPVDVQVVPLDTSKVNPEGLPTIIVSKLRSQSWTDGLSGTANVAEFIKRIQEQAATTTTTTTIAGTATTTTTTTTSLFSGLTTPELIYGTKYLNGHSVVQMDMESNVIFSNNAAIFAKTKNDAITLLGSAQKLGDNELLIGDAYNKRAIITYTNLDTQKPQIEWEYTSDRYISDFHIIAQDDVNISIRDDTISDPIVFIRQGSLVIWQNNSSVPISIYSGVTTYDQFMLDPDLNLYGSEFKSGVLQPGERYSFKFVMVDEYGWFVYPGILVGKINVTKNRISSRDQFIVLENDGLDSPFSSRVMKVDAYGNIQWSFGESYLVKPRDARPLINGGVIIST